MSGMPGKNGREQKMQTDNDKIKNNQCPYCGDRLKRDGDMKYCTKCYPARVWEIIGGYPCEHERVG